MAEHGGPHPSLLPQVRPGADTPTRCRSCSGPTVSSSSTTSATPVMEDLLYESDPVRRFVGLRLTGPLPDETTILNFRHLLERHELGPALLEEINAHLESQGLRLREGTIVDAGIIEAPSSTKNRSGERDPEMHQTKKGNQWHFGMKAHIGVDADSGIVHRIEHHGSQCARCDRGAQSAARRGDAGVVRCRIPGGPPFLRPSGRRPAKMSGQLFSINVIGVTQLVGECTWDKPGNLVRRSG